MICPYCSGDSEPRRFINTHIASKVQLVCGHIGVLNPNRGMPLSYSTEEVHNPATGMLGKKRVAHIDERELLTVEEFEPELSPVNPDSIDVGKIAIPAKEEEKTRKVTAK